MLSTGECVGRSPPEHCLIGAEGQTRKMIATAQQQPHLQPPASFSQRSRTFLRCWRPPGRAGPCAAPSAITMLPQLSLRPDSESCSLSSAQIWTSFFPGTTNNLRCPDPATRPGRSAGRAGPGRGGFSSPGSGSSGGKLRRPSYYGGAGRATPHRPARPRL